MMSLIISNALKDVLLSSYVNIKWELAVKTITELIDKPNVEIYHEKIIDFINNTESPLIQKLKQRIPLVPSMKTMKDTIISDGKQITKFECGQAVFLCNSYNCPLYQMLNPHLEFIYSNQHHVRMLIPLKVAKSHSHSSKIYKL